MRAVPHGRVPLSGVGHVGERVERCAAVRRQASASELCCAAPPLALFAVVGVPALRACALCCTPVIGVFGGPPGIGEFIANGTPLGSMMFFVRVCVDECARNARTLWREADRFSAIETLLMR